VKLTEYIKLQDNIYEVTSKVSEDNVAHSRVVTFPVSLWNWYIAHRKTPTFS